MGASLHFIMETPPNPTIPERQRPARFGRRAGLLIASLARAVLRFIARSREQENRRTVIEPAGERRSGPEGVSVT